VNVVKLTCESALGSGQAICIALVKEVYCVCSRVDNGRSGYADCVLDIIAESIGRLESRISYIVHLNGLPLSFSDLL
jgi:hypothetical protein